MPGSVYILRRAVALSFLAVIVAAVWFVVSLFQPFTGSGHGQIEVNIAPGATVSQIGSQLQRDGVISSGFFFKLRTMLDGDRGKLLAGSYELRLGMSYSAVLSQLIAGPDVHYVNLTIIPGRSRRQIQAQLRTDGVKGNYVADTVRSSILNPVLYGAPRNTPTLEGFLWPDTYNLHAPVRVGDLIHDQLKRFKQEFATVNLAYARSKNLTGYDVLKIASLIAEESMLPGDGPKVAAVIYNRLREGIDLGLDSTVSYATGNYGTLTARDLASKSPWNTTNHPGLPPTPIDNPGMQDIQYAAHPAHTQALYFINRVCGNGALRFTASYSVFLQWSADWNDAVAAAHGNIDKAEFCKHAP